MKILLTHPGTQYAPRLAAALHQQGLLYKFATGIAFGDEPESRLWKIARFLQKEKTLLKRVVPGLPASKLHLQPIKEALAIFRHQVLGQTNDQVFFPRNKAFQQQIPQNLIDAADAVIGFDTSSWILAERCRKAGKPFILDVSIAHPLAKEKAFAELREKYPEWAAELAPKLPRNIEVELQEIEMADHIVVASSFTKKTYTDHGVPAEKISLNPYGTDLGRRETGEVKSETGDGRRENGRRETSEVKRENGRRETGEVNSETSEVKGENGKGETGEVKGETGEVKGETSDGRREKVKSETSEVKGETGDWRRENGRSETSDVKWETGEGKRETGNVKWETSNVKRETLDGKGEAEFGERGITFLFFGALSARKGFPWLCEVWRSFYKQNPHCRLLAAGYDFRPAVYEVPEGVEVLGAIHPSDRAALFAAADVFVFPSFFEGFGQVILEAMACGLPVITTTATAAPDLWTAGKAGLMVEPGNNNSLLEALHFFVENPQATIIMGAAARQSAQAFTWEAYGENWKRILTSLTSGEERG